MGRCRYQRDGTMPVLRQFGNIFIRVFKWKMEMLCVWIQYNDIYAYTGKAKNAADVSLPTPLKSLRIHTERWPRSSYHIHGRYLYKVHLVVTLGIEQ